MENNKKAVSLEMLNDSAVAGVGGGKRQKCDFDKILLEEGGYQTLSDIAKGLGMSEYVVSSSSYLDDHDGKESYDTVECELKLKCPTSKLKKGSDFGVLMSLDANK